MPGPDPMEMIQIQHGLRMLETEFVGRYLNNPDNYGEIEGIMEQAAVALYGLEARGGCPGGTAHSPTCKCVPPFFHHLDLEKWEAYFEEQGWSPPEPTV